MTHELVICAVATALIAVGCGDKSDTTSVGNRAGGAGAGSTSASGGSGGGASVGGSSQGGGGTGGFTVLDYHTQDTLKGAVATVADSVSSVTGTAGGNQWCVAGSVGPCQINPTSEGCDSWPWAGIGWALNEDPLPDGGIGALNGADLTQYTKIAIGLSGADGLTLMLQFSTGESTAPIASPSDTYHCGPLPATGTAGDGMLLSSLTESCWDGGGGAPFDPATMQPKILSVNVLNKTSQSQSFDFCITRLELLP
jgi:hypothetical protein